MTQPATIKYDLATRTFILRFGTHHTISVPCDLSGLAKLETILRQREIALRDAQPVTIGSPGAPNQYQVEKMVTAFCAKREEKRAEEIKDLTFELEELGL